ncbi:ChbG/HpnK family deacetylase [soil metagenome]
MYGSGLHVKGPKRVVLCADDYGLTGGVSDAIAGLIAAGRLTATSAMTTLPAWAPAAGPLRSVIAEHPADVGLHLTLTDQRSAVAVQPLATEGRLPPLSRLLAMAEARRLPHAAVRDEIRGQLDRFEAAWGGPPDYVDGHQHVHVLPGVREPLLDELDRRYGPARIWLRNCAESPARALGRRVAVGKAWLLFLLGHRFAALARARGYAINEGFSGLHDFSDRLPYRQLMQRFLTHLGPAPLIHVHPGHVDAELEAIDPLTTPRESELSYLASEQFAAALAAADVTLVRFSSLAN